MPIPELLLVLLLLVYIATLPKLFERAGEASWKGYIPIYNFLPWLKITGRPWWWIILLLTPGVNLIMLVIMNIEMGIVFNKRSAKEQWIFGVAPWYALVNLAYKENAEFIGPRSWEKVKKSSRREWGEAILFAVVAATIIRTFFIEAFTIPTPSMEGSMLVGDYLFVSKMSYGPKVPQTPVSFPFIHNTMPNSQVDSYVEWFSLPYYRLPGFGDVERFDPVVFNFPHGDTILVDPYYAGHDYYSILRSEAIQIAGTYDKYLADQEKYKELARVNFEEKKVCNSCSQNGQGPRGIKIGGLKRRPVDKEENYIKRCIGLPGDELKVVEGQVMINGEAIENPEFMQREYIFRLKNADSRENVIADVNSICRRLDKPARDFSLDQARMGVVITSFTDEQFDIVKRMTSLDTIFEVIEPKSDENFMMYFPNTHYGEYKTWSKDNYGPVHIPAKGETIELTMDNLPIYERAITVYEGNTLSVKDGKIFINGAASTNYTFRLNYYWMMGDNRHNSADSRAWGFVPETHVVGKAIFTWFSKENNAYHGRSNIRWDRMFRTVD